jgi:mono/diheme cytochrome c family protein
MRHAPARFRPGGLVAVLAGVLLVAGVVRAQSEWTIPDEAPGLVSPLEVTSDVVKKGAEIFNARCRKCHGAAGRGNGPYSDPEHPAADLTRPEVGNTPDGVLFYKIWNGRRPMPAFKVVLEREDVWKAVAFVKTLSQGAAAPAAQPSAQPPAGAPAE